MMVPFDGSGGPPPGSTGGGSGGGQPMPRPPMPPGQGGPGMPGMPPHMGHGPPPPPPPHHPYGHRNSGMGGYMPPQSPRNSGYGGPPPPPPYSTHPPLHSPQQPPMHPGMHGGPPPPPHQIHRSNSLGAGGLPQRGMMGPPPHHGHQTSGGYMSNSSQNRAGGGYMNNNSQGHSMNSSSGHHSVSHHHHHHAPPPPQHHAPPQHAPPPPPPPPQQQIASQPQHAPPQPPNGNSSGNWQSESDTPHRREMIQLIVKMLRKDKNGSPEAMSKLPQMAKQLEVSLYRNARSFEAYKDPNTLKQRLQQIAVEVSRKARSKDKSAGSTSSSNNYSNDGRSSAGAPPPMPQQQQFANGGGGVNSMARRADHDMQTGANSPFMGGSTSQGGGQQRMVKMDDINALPNSQNQHSSSNYPSQQHRASTNDGSNRGTSSQQQQRSSTSHPQQQEQQAPGSGSRNDPGWKIRIRHKQQRLLLLHHSAKCTAEDGRCSVTPHCADMKRLWRHMEGCKDNNCSVSHCFSSRAILSHYRKCRDPACPACGPVRETVRKSRNTPPGGASSSSQQQHPGANSTGPMMDNMRSSVPPPPSPQQQLSPHPGGSSGNNNSDMVGAPSRQDSFSVGSSGGNQISFQPQQNRPPSSHGNMAPPNGSVSQQHNYQPSPSNSNNFQQQQRRSTGGPSNGQPVYDRHNGDRVSSSSTSTARVRNAAASNPVQLSGSAAAAQANAADPRTNDSEWQKIRHKQQRLLLLRHASRCQHEAGQCPVTPHCASMKKLWEHIAHCKNQSCTVQHCLSSRYVLSHYRRCRDPRCPACGPVRETIRKSHERDKEKQRNGESAMNDDMFMGRGGSGRNSTNPTISTSDARASSSPSYEPLPKRARPDGDVPSSPIAPQSAPPPAPTVAQADVGRSIGKKEAKGESTDRSVLDSFTVAELQTHLASLERKTQLTPSKLKAKCTELLRGLMTHHHGWVFNVPVDPVELNLPDYFEIVKKPMDLGTINKKLEGGGYHSLDDFSADVYLTFDNAMTYNEESSVVHDMAKELRTKFESDRTALLAHLEAEDQQRRQNERACVLCGCEKLLFEPPVYFCNGMNCQSQRIRRNSHFYIGGNNQYFWCSACYGELDDKLPIELMDMTLHKAELRKKKNDEVHEESWVQCDTCERWVHQICGLFNTRQNKEHHSEYCCPQCLLDKRSRDAPPLRPPGAEDLPRTTLSEWIESCITKRIAKRKREIAEEKAANDGISLEEATRIVESGGPVIVRQVTSMVRSLEVRELMQKRYAHKNYPKEFPFRCKCLVVFQKLDGVDVVLFALYVYEHDASSPPPNDRCVYISYLDSVHFMRPRKLRTFVYHEILIAYLDYARKRGFSTAHIWACPPLKGDDYIFYAKPEDQKTPRDSRLRLWYIDMLLECQKRNIVGKVTNMYDLYFADENIDATAVPYLEGDYFPGEAENIIKILEEGGGKKPKGGNKKTSKSNISKNKGSTGTRSSGMDEEALIASGAFDGVRSFKDLDRDQVMVKLGETIQPMKDSFIVAFLNWKDARPENLVVPEAIEKARIEYATKDGGELLAGSKRDLKGHFRDASSKTGDDGQPIKVIDDDGEDLDCEILNNRQAFLNLCRGNHYQFDELRRAKHTSMMVLWHLHNRDAPKFVMQCVACNREILSGKRYHCNTCQDYDLCSDCFRDPNANRGNCQHKLVPIAVEPDASQDRSGLSEQERQQRQRNLELHIQLIEHASRCKDKGCSSSNCAKMKQYLAHAKTCRVKVTGGCRICKRIWTLLRIHAQRCKDPNCQIPQCTAIREKMRQLQKQQQAMDDRRRIEMNRHMRFSVTGQAGN